MPLYSNLATVGIFSDSIEMIEYPLPIISKNAASIKKVFHNSKVTY
jgi:hypothetical protein